MLKGETNVYDETEKPEIALDLKEAINDVAALRNLTFSDKMYTNPVLYSKHTVGLESGNIRGLKRRNPAPTKELITTAHEAHIRLGLWLALSRRNYRHTSSMQDNVDRKKKWLKMAALVKKDRADNAKNTHEARAKYLPNVPDEGLDGGDDESLDSDFYE